MKMLGKTKIATKLLIVCTLLIISLVVVALAVTEAGKGMTGLAEEQMLTRSKEIAYAIDQVLNEEKKLTLGLAARPDVRYAASVLAAGGMEKAAAEIEVLNVELRTYAKTKGLGDDLQAVFCADVNGVTFAASDGNVGVSIAERPYFQQALAGKVNAGAAAKNKVTGKPFVPVAAPIYSDAGEVVGVMGSLLEISFVNTMIGEAKLGKTGYAFVIDGTGLVIAHPDPGLVFKLNALKVEGLSESVREMMAGQSGVDKYVFEGVSKTCGFAPVQNTGWV
jgi:methyl-accepting chemotaxis protein